MNRVAVEPEVLRWARRRSRRDDLDRRFPKLEAWEREEVKPTLKQLEAFARATRTPIGYLFLSEPPLEVLPIKDFRTMGDKDVDRPSPDLLDTLYLCQQRQDWYREEARSGGEEPNGFIGSLDASVDIRMAGSLIRDALSFDVEQRARLRTWTEALRQFIAQAESLGVLVMVSGVVGNNTHRKLDPGEFRGFALSDPFAPLVFVNGADTKAAQMFTLAHEIAHLWLGETGVSNIQALPTPDHAVERWCNKVAAELLVPWDAISSEFDVSADLEEEIQRLARRFKVSTLVILRSLSDIGELDRDRFWLAYWEEMARIRDYGLPGGGNYYQNAEVRASRRFVRILVASTLEGRTSFTEALRLLDLKKASALKEIARRTDLAV